MTELHQAPGEPSAEAYRVREILRERHADCLVVHCPARGLWAEDVQEVLDVATDRAAASHIEYTVDMLAEQLRQDPDGAAAMTLADDPELLRVLARTARESVGVCPACDGSGARELQWHETAVGPEDCPRCEGVGWLTATRQEAP